MKNQPRRIAIFGSTGSIGRQTLQVAAHLGLQVVGLIAGSNRELLLQQIERFQPEWAVLQSGDQPELRVGRTTLASGERAVVQFSRDHQADIVVSAISGIAGLRPTWNAVQSGVTVALANKESLATAGHLLLPAVRRANAELLPVDSEHSALWQCLEGRQPESVRRLILTASGGPLRDWPKERLAGAALADVLNHPTWQMGNRVTIDSATLMNKGLEVIEAHWLFDMDYKQIDVLVHPQSIVHSLVELVDGSVLAQLSPPDMRLPIQVALTHPKRADSPWPKLDLAEAAELSFQPPRYQDFPCLRLAIQAGRQGGSYPVVLNAANEVAVAAFQAGVIGFGGIAELVAGALDQHHSQPVDDIAAVLELDRATRQAAERLLQRLTSSPIR
jgi:1-deoxy-D-xylulose-5-phosphate reductoisomerase